MISSRRSLLALSAAAVLALPAAQALAKVPTEAQMLQLQDKFMAALAGTDMDALAGMLSENLTFMHPQGQVNTKAIQMNAMRTGPLPRYVKVDQKNTKVKAYNGVAVLTGDILYTSLPRPGQPPPAANPYRLTSVYADEKGTWRLVNWQVTAIAPPPAAAPKPAQ